MIEVFGNLWTYPANWRGITTNGMVKKDGGCVMGRGCALQAKLKYPGFDKRLGALIRETGNDVYWFEDLKLFTFPVKYNWYEKADLGLISESAYALDTTATNFPDETFLLPRPGCSNGKLAWEQVKPYIEFLPDNVKVITY